MVVRKPHDDSSSPKVAFPQAEVHAIEGTQMQNTIMVTYIDTKIVQLTSSQQHKI